MKGNGSERSTCRRIRVSERGCCYAPCFPPGPPDHQVRSTRSTSTPGALYAPSTRTSGLPAILHQEFLQVSCPGLGQHTPPLEYSTRSFPWNSWWAYLGLDLLTWYVCSLPVSLPASFGPPLYLMSAFVLCFLFSPFSYCIHVWASGHALSSLRSIHLLKESSAQSVSSS